MLTEDIMEVESHKHLGVYLSNDCSWHTHIEYIKTKAWGRVNIMRKLKYVLDRKSLETIYLSFIRPLLEYSDVIWDNCTSIQKYELEKIQYEAARIATGSTKLVSIKQLEMETGWEALESRRLKHKLVLFFKMVTNQTPAYLSALVPPLVGEESRYNLRNTENIQLVHARTKLYSESFLPSVIREWNCLPLYVRNSSSTASFKLAISGSSRIIPTYYFVGNRKAQILHTRLRTNCSSINL